MAMKTKKNVKSKMARKGKVVKGVGAKKNVRKGKAKKVATLNKSAIRKNIQKKRLGKKAPKKELTKRIRGKAENVGTLEYENTGLGAETGGQSGDTQGLSGIEEAESESVKELLEEGQSFEAEVVQGVESVPDADQGEVRTHEVPEDDIPGEYTGKDGQN